MLLYSVLSYLSLIAIRNQACTHVFKHARTHSRARAPRQWHNFDTTLCAIQNLREAQRKAWRAARDILELSEPHRYADFLDRLLQSALAEVRPLTVPRGTGEAPKLDPQGLPEASLQLPKEISKEEAMKMLAAGGRQN